MLAGSGKPVIVGVALGVCVGVCGGAAWAGEAGSSAPAGSFAAAGLDAGKIGAVVVALLILIGLVAGKVLRPGALGERGLRKVDVHPWWVWLLCGVMVFCAMILGASLAGEVMAASGRGPAPGAQASEQYQAVTGLVEYTAALVAAAVLVRLLRATAPQAGLAAPPKSFAIGLGWLVVFFPVVYSAGVVAVAIQQARTGQEITDRLAHPTLKTLAENHGNVWGWAVAAVAIVLAPILEEVVFRAFLQTALLRLLGRPWLSILLASLVFAAAHYDLRWYAIASIFVLGLAMGFVFERTRMLGASIAMHMGFNALNVAMAVWGPS